MKRRFKVFALVLAMAFCLPIFTENPLIFDSITAFAEETSATELTTPPPSTEQTEAKNNKTETNEILTEEYQPVFSFPTEMRAVTVVPGVDFAKEEGKTDEEILAEIDELITNIQSKGMNSIIVKTSYDGKAFYSTDINQSVKKNPVELAIKAAKDRGLFAYITFDINFVLGQLVDAPLQERIDYLALQSHIFTVKYAVDGVVLEGYYSSKSNTSFSDYMQNGSGIGFDNWLLDNGAYVFSLVSDAIRKTNNTIPVGIMLKDVWANYTTNENGSNTNDNFQALSDGYADTLAYIKNGYADFVMLKADGSISDKALPFEEIIKWWAKNTVDAKIPLYVMHSNEKICTEAAGWGSPDQLVQQIISARKVKGYNGSAFESYSALQADVGESTKVISEYYGDNLNMETINNELNIISPKRTSFTTEEPAVDFMGSFDPNFKVLFNGKEIELNEAGNFYYHEELDIGSNVFTIQNKGKTIKYTIIRMVTVLKGIEPTGDMAIEERSNIVISANAYRGSNVTAKLNGKTIKLNPTEEQLEGYENSAYIRYTGIYVAPKGIVNKAQNLGHVVVTGTYKGKDGTPFIMNLTGGNVTINPLPEVPNNADGSLIVVRNDNTQTFDYLTTNNVATPDKCRLPAGTVDYVVKKVTYSGQDWKTSYYLTNSGKRISCSDVNVQENEPLGANNIVAKEAYIDGGDTVIKISSSIKMPFSMSYGGVNFGASGEGNFKVQNFTATSVTFTFDYSTSASGELSFPSGSIFSSANWSDTVINGVNKYQLTLTLSQAGKFNGVRATYDGEGNLLLRFNGNKNSLSGAVVVLDPGHGIKNGKLDPGGVGHITDQAIGLALSKRVEEKLRAEGATVYRLPTESQEIDVYSRSVVASQYNPDIFISIHGNTAPGSPNATGVEAYYFTPFSQPLAKSLSSAVGNYYTNVAYGGGDHNRGDKYSYYIVTLDQSFASVLLEVGFVTNYKEAMILNNPQHQDGIANAIVTGCRNYMSR